MLKRKTITAPAPAYGSLDYWEGRYQSRQRLHRYNEHSVNGSKNRDGDPGLAVNDNNVSDGPAPVRNDISNPNCASSNRNEKELNIVQQDDNVGDASDSSSKEATNCPPGHAWYLTYDELSPLLLPLLIENSGAKVILTAAAAPTPGDGKTIKKNVLEIGCGEVPLGADLVKEKKLVLNSGECILNRVVCCDYSETIINILREWQKKQQILRDNRFKSKHGNGSGVPQKPTRYVAAADNDNKIGSNIKNEGDKCADNQVLEVEYVVADARKLTYANETFHMVIDKGTMDSMLSDRVAGIENCVNIVAESARVLTKNGVIVIVSHVNGKTSSGIQWVEEVILPGLRKGAVNATWFIEAHGKNSDTCDNESSESSMSQTGSSSSSYDDDTWVDHIFEKSSTTLGSDASSSCLGSDEYAFSIVSDDEDDDPGVKYKLSKSMKNTIDEGLIVEPSPTVYIIRNTSSNIISQERND